MKIDCVENKKVVKKVVEVEEVTKEMVVTLDRETALALCAVMGRIGTNRGIYNHPLKIFSSIFYDKCTQFFGIRGLDNPYRKTFEWEAGSAGCGGINITKMVEN